MNSTSSNVNATCDSITNMGLIRAHENYHVLINRSFGQEVLLQECSPGDMLISEHVVKCMANQTWRRERTFFPNVTDWCATAEDKRLYLCFDRDIVRNCDKSDGIDHEISALVFGFISCISIVIIIALIICLIKTRQKTHIVRTIAGYGSQAVVRHLTASSDYNTIDSDYFDDQRYETVDEKIKTHDQRSSLIKAIELENCLVRNPSYENFKSM